MPKKKSNSRQQEGQPLLWASVLTGLTLIASGIYYLIPSERVNSSSMVAINITILGFYVIVLIWSIVAGVIGVMQRNFKAIVPFVLNLVTIVIYTLTAAVQNNFESVR